MLSLSKHVAAPRQWLDEQAHAHPGRLAIASGGQRLTFAALAERAARVSGRLRELAVGRGDRVALLSGNRLESAEWLHGITRLGAVAVPLGARLTAAEVSARLRTAPCRVLVFEPATAAVAARLGDLVATRIDLETRWSGAPADAVPLDLAAPHSVIFTSGSSGAPKGVVLTAANHLASAQAAADRLGVREDDRWLACLPFNHVGGLSILMRSAVHGLPVIVHEQFDAARVDAALDRDHVTLISVVATMLQRLLDQRGARAFPSSLRCILLGGGPAPRALLDECARRGVPVAPTYGMTEAASQIATRAPHTEAPPDSVGHPLPGVELRIRRGDRACASGEVGEIEVRGASISPGYLRDGTFVPHGEWLQTRDLGRLGEDGSLTVVGRADDVIITGGENVHPREVEQVLEAHPSVLEACVFGLPDERWGESVAACVRLRTGAHLDRGALMDHARLSLAGFKLPRRIEAVDDFPRSAAGKVLRREVSGRGAGAGS